MLFELSQRLSATLYFEVRSGEGVTMQPGTPGTDSESWQNPSYAFVNSKGVPPLGPLNGGVALNSDRKAYVQFTLLPPEHRVVCRAFGWMITDAKASS